MGNLFRGGLFGYNKQEVEAHVAKLTEELQQQRTKLEQMQQQQEQLTEQIKKYRQQERYITGALVQAQSHAVAMQQQADEHYEKTLAHLREQTQAWEQRIGASRKRLLDFDRQIQQALEHFHQEVVELAKLSAEEDQSVLTGQEGAQVAGPQTDVLPTQEPPEAAPQASDAPAASRVERADATPAPAEKTPEEAPKDDLAAAVRTPDAPKADAAPTAAQQPAGKTPEDAPPAPQVDADLQKLYWRLHNLEQGEAPQTPQVDAASLESTVRPDELKKLEALCRELGILGGADSAAQ